MRGDDVTLHVMEINGNNVRLGVEAPKSLPVYREEIWASVKQENKEAAAAASATRMPRRAASV
jgi:carbon storage regulator